MPEDLARRRVPTALRARVATIIERTDQFCRTHLDEEYAELTRQLVARVARKRPSPLERGDPGIWAATCLHVIAFVNDLFQPDGDVHLPPDRFAALTGQSRRTVENKSRGLRKLYGIERYEPEYCHPHLLAEHPYAWLVEIDGLVVDARTLPPQLQADAVRRGLIPSLPDRPSPDRPSPDRPSPDCPSPDCPSPGGPNYASDDPMAAAQRAASADELRRLLATADLPCGGDSSAAEAAALLERCHREDPDGAVETALLLCTARRWDRVTDDVIDRISASEVLDDAALDELALRLCWENEARFHHPAGWYADGWLSIDLQTLTTEHVPTDDDERIFSQRPIAPPLRRWAVERLLRRGQADAGTVRRQAAALNARGRQALMLGLVDAIDALPEPDARRVLDDAVQNGDARVRRSALERVLARDGRDAVLELAAGDSSAGIRRWLGRLQTEHIQPGLLE